MSQTRATVAHNVVYLRLKPDNGTEQVSQLLIGAPVTVLATEGGWSYVEGDDTYRGWADSRWLAEGTTSAPTVTVTSLFADLREGPAFSSPLIVRLSMLSRVTPLPPLTDAELGVTNVAGTAPVLLADGITRGYLPTESLSPLPHVAPERIAASAAEWSTHFLGTPYLWGGSSSWGLDCSGLVQFCYRLAGLILLRDADQQRNDARFVPVAEDALESGDLVFFGAGPEKITHIGIYYRDGVFIHAAGGSGTIRTPVGDDRYWPKFIDARRLDPERAGDPIVRFESETR